MVRAQCIVLRDDRILLVKNNYEGRNWHCLPGGLIEHNETPQEAVLRELKEECLVDGRVLRKTGEWFDGELATITFLVDIGDQEPDVTKYSEFRELAIVGCAWLKLSEVPERDRAYLWAAGLLGVPSFGAEVLNWGADISYPNEIK